MSPVLLRIIFILLLLFSTTPWASPPIALLLGIAFGVLFTNPYADRARRGSTQLLQLSVVALGFGMNLQQVLRAGRSGFLYTAAGIVFVLLSGWALGKMLQVKPTAAFLISAGTAICGGSAIAAVGPITGA